MNTLGKIAVAGVLAASGCRDVPERADACNVLLNQSIADLQRCDSLSDPGAKSHCFELVQNTRTAILGACLPSNPNAAPLTHEDCEGLKSHLIKMHCHAMVKGKDNDGGPEN